MVESLTSFDVINIPETSFGCLFVLQSTPWLEMVCSYPFHFLRNYYYWARGIWSLWFILFYLFVKFLPFILLSLVCHIIWSPRSLFVDFRDLERKYFLLLLHVPSDNLDDKTSLSFAGLVLTLIFWRLWDSIPYVL